MVKSVWASAQDARLHRPPMNVALGDVLPTFALVERITLCAPICGPSNTVGSTRPSSDV